nr:DUF2510 domain-containing protein [Streptomyces pactum]
MSAPTSGSADGSSIPGYYPDPSIPDYIRYWDGAAWVPGTSRPAPAEGEPLPAPPPGLAAVPPGAHPEPAVPPVVRPESAVPAVVHPEPEPSSVRTQITAAVPDETGPMFLDEPPAGEVPPAAVPGPRPGGNAAPEPRPGEGPGPTAARPAADVPRRPHGTRPEPATAWQADAARQSGFGGERDRRVSWGSGTGPTVPLPDPRGGESQAAGPAADRAPDGAAADRAGTEDRAAAAAGSGAAGGAAPAGTPRPARPAGRAARGRSPCARCGPAPRRAPRHRTGTP